MGIEISKARRKKRTYQRKAEEARWAARSGEVTVRRVEEPSPPHTTESDDTPT